MLRVFLVLACLAAAAPAVAQSDADSQSLYTKPGFLMGEPSQKALLALFNKSIGSPPSRAVCIERFAGFHDLMQRLAEARSNIGTGLVASWQHCAAAYFPADTADECGASVDEYRRLVAADARFESSHLPGYLNSFCGTTLPRR